MPRGGRPAAVWMAAALLFGPAAAQAQLSGLRITPTFSAELEVTDNRNLSATDPKADAILTVTPGIRISSWSGPLQGSLNFGLSGVVYAREPSESSLRLDNTNDLNADFTFEVVDQHVFIDARASITQQSSSAFGLQADRPNSVNANNTEWRTLTVSPYLRGKLFEGEVDVEARWTSEYRKSSGASAGTSSSHDARVAVSGGGGYVGWSVVASRSYDDFGGFEGGRATVNDRITPIIWYAPEPGLRFFLSGGYERNDVLSADPVTYKNWGAGVAWQPTPRTQFSGQVERRYFGNSWNISFSHRMRRAVVTYTDSNSDNNATTGAGAPLTTYDLFFAQFVSIEPDPALRDILVRNFLRSAGLDPDQQVSGGFINKAVTVTRSQNLSLAVQGQRNTAVLSAFATSSRRVDTLSTAQDDLTQVYRLDQQGISLTLSHRLTPTSSAGLIASAQRTPSSDGVQGNEWRELTVFWSERVGARSSVSLEGRHTQATGANPYRENSLLARFNHDF